MINDYSDRFRRLDEIMAKYDEAMHLNEVLFGNQENLKRHYEKHITDAAIDGEIQMKYMSIDDFNELADIISSAPAGSIIKSSKPSENKRVIGYVTKSGNFVKYDTVSGLKVIYRPANQGGAISLYRQGQNKFMNIALGRQGDPKFKKKDGDFELPPQERAGVPTVGGRSIDDVSKSGMITKKE